MKKLKVILTAIVLTGFALTSCSKDDDSSVPASIETKWNQIKTNVQVGGQSFDQLYTENVEGCSKNYIEFAAAGVYKDVVYFKQSGTCNESVAEPGTWTKSGDNLTITNGGDLTGTYKVTKLTGAVLNIQTESSNAGVTTKTTVFFQRAN